MKITLKLKVIKKKKKEYHKPVLDQTYKKYFHIKPIYKNKMNRYFLKTKQNKNWHVIHCFKSLK